MIEDKLKDRMKILTDSVLLHCYAMNTSGLYYGKTGMSFALFEASRILKDNYIEDQAFVLLEESLLTFIKSTNFQNGLAGIAYAVELLNERNFIQIDLLELWEQKIDQIREEIMHLESCTSMNTFSNIDYARFLEKIKIDNHVGLQKKLLDDVGLFLKGVFSDLCIGKRTGLSIYSIMCMWKHFLEVTSFCHLYVLPLDIVELYGLLFDRGLLPCSIEVGFYLRKCLMNSDNLNCWKYLIKKNIERDSDLHTCFSLREQLNKLFILNECGYDVSEFVENRYLNTSIDQLESKLICLINNKDVRISLYEGISGLLCFLSAFYLKS